MISSCRILGGIALAAVALSVRFPAEAQQPAYSESFERYSPASGPESWVDSHGAFRIAQDPLVPSNTTYGAQHADPKQRSVWRKKPGDRPEGGDLTTLTSHWFTNAGEFELRGRFFRATPESLLGVTIFSDLPEGQSYRMVALWRRSGETDPVLRLYRSDGVAFEGRADSGSSPAPGVWHRFVIRGEHVPGGTRIRARVWPDGEREPGEWPIDALDDEALAGRIGLWSAFGAAYFDDLSVEGSTSEVEDTAAPAIFFSESGVAIDAGASAAFNREAKIDVRAVDASGVAALDIRLDGAAVASGEPIASEGPHRLRVHAVDSKGNASDAEIEVVIDTTAPVITITESGEKPPDALLTNRILTPVIEVQDLTETRVESTLDEAPFVSASTVTAEGPHRLRVTATDAVGWSASREWTFTIDRTPPEVAITSPVQNERFGTRTVAVRGSSGDAVSVSVNGVQAAVDLAARTFSVPSLQLLEGPNGIVATGLDAAGNSTATRVEVQLDTRGPELTVDPTPPCTGATSLDLHGTVFDAGISAVVVAIDGASSNAAIEGRNWTASVPLGPEGVKAITVEAADAAGHRSAQSFEITVDRSAPAIDLRVNGAPFTASLLARSIAPAFLVTDLDPGTVALASLDGQPFQSGDTIAAEGAHALRVTARDCAGNEQTREQAFTIDLTAPRFLSFEPPDGAKVTAVPSTLRGTADGDAVEVRADGAVFPVSGGSFTMPSPPFGDGVNRLSLQVADAAGNVGRATYTVGVRTTEPLVEIVEDGEPLEDGAVFHRPVVPRVRLFEEGVTFTASLNGAPFTSGSEVATDGSYTIAATAHDPAFGTFELGLSHIQRRSKRSLSHDRLAARRRVDRRGHDGRRSGSG